MVNDPTGQQRWRFRFGLRALMALPVLIALGIFLVDRIWVKKWTQAGTELISLTVLDESDKPVAGASVELTGGPTQVESTRPDGTVAFAVPYSFSAERSILRETRNWEHDWRIDVSADGYEETTTRLQDHRQDRDRDFAIEYPIVIRLRQR